MAILTFALFVNSKQYAEINTGINHIHEHRMSILPYDYKCDNNPFFFTAVNFTCDAQHSKRALVWVVVYYLLNQ